MRGYSKIQSSEPSPRTAHQIRITLTPFTLFIKCMCELMKRFNCSSGGLLFCCRTKKRCDDGTNAWPVSGKGHLITAHTRRLNIQAVYPFLKVKTKKIKVLICLFIFKNEKGVIYSFYCFKYLIKKMNERNIHRTVTYSYSPTQFEWVYVPLDGNYQLL